MTESRGDAMRGSQRGSALVYTLLTVAMLSLFTSIIYDRLLNLMKSSRDWLWKERARAAAESGTAVAMSRLVDDPYWSAEESVADDPLKFVLDDAAVSVRTKRFRPPDIIWIFASGSYQRERKETVEPLLISDPTLFAVLARRGVRLGPGSIVTGPVSGGSVRMEDASEVVGSVISSGDLRMDADFREALVFDSVASPPVVPVIDPAVLRAGWTRKFPTDLPADSAIRPGRYLHSGDLTLSNVTRRGVSLYVTGNLILEGNVKLEGREDTPVLIVGKNLTGSLKGCRIRGVVYVTGRTELRGEGLITGTLISDEADLSAGAVVQSFDAVINAPRPSPNFFGRKVGRLRN
ncbi:polymer-forming cytoskeletal protein [bacterium]|nr:polymer-forming cytoskeletal protein [bacterium]